MPVNRDLRLAMGMQGLVLAVPESVALVVPRPLQDSVPAPIQSPAELLRAALQAPVAGPPLSELAAGKRRAVVLVGDLSYPAPYPLLLPELCRVLAELGIRPTRISFLCCPGASGPVLGRLAVRGYGAETVGEHELRAWTWGAEGPEERDSLFDAADLKLAMLPTLPAALAALPHGVRPEWALAVSPALGLVVSAAAIRAGPPQALFSSAETGSLGGAGTEELARGSTGWQVSMASGGGDPTDATLEEALVGLRPGTQAGSGASGVTRVLFFAGTEGLGSARFTLDLWWLLKWISQAPSTADPLPPEPPFVGPWNPLQVLAEVLRRDGRIVLFSPGLAEHHEGDDLRARLAESPALAERLFLITGQDELWAKLEAWHGARFALCAEPLGWRGLCS